MSAPRTIFLFDMMRHRSHLFFRYLGTHPDIVSMWHPFLPAFLFGPERILSRTTNSQGQITDQDAKWKPQLSNETYADAEAKLQQAVVEATAQHKTLVANEHSQMVCKQDLSLSIIHRENVQCDSNPTVIPDALFNSLIPVFVIRNPIFSVPSNYKMLVAASEMLPGGEDWKLITGIAIQHRLFQFFLKRDGKAPVVVDGDDVVWRTNELGERLCEVLGLTQGGLQEAWEQKEVGLGRQDDLVKAFLYEINHSTGVQRRTKAPVPADLDETYKEWTESLGSSVANELRETVVANIPFYEDMRKYAI